MRIIIDYLYSNQLTGILTTFAVLICIMSILYLVQRYDIDRKKNPVKFYCIWLIHIISGSIFIFMIVQISANPFSIGRAGTIHQSAILENTVVFVDTYAQAGMEFGDTPPMIRIWVINRQTGELITRKKADSYKPIAAANDTSLLIHENDDWYITDDKFKPAITLIKNKEYNGRKVHVCTFSDGILTIALKDFSSIQLGIPFHAARPQMQNSIKIKFLDTDHDAYQITSEENNQILWIRDQSIGTLLQNKPEIKYESSSSDLYLVWTQNKLVALSKLTGKTIWTFSY